MNSVLHLHLEDDEAAIWFIGQAGCIVRSSGITIAVDPYLSDSVAKIAPELSRLYPSPIAPEDLQVDIMVITHDHQDHLDPETIAPYRFKDNTLFVAPRLTIKSLVALGVPEQNIRRIDAGESDVPAEGVKVTGIYAVPTDADALDTTGYLFEFTNGRSFYHCSDTAYSELLLETAPRTEVLFVCINGKWRNLNIDQAVRLTSAVNPRYAIPCHYDVMALNSENPASFSFFLGQSCQNVEAKILEVMKPFIWK